MCEKQLAQLAERAARTGVSQLTGFLSPAERAEAEICARKAGISLKAWGGMENAERCVAAFAEEDVQPDFPIACLQIAWRDKYATLGHRDILGAILALGIDRVNLGDITVGKGEASAFILDRMADYVKANLGRAGSTSVSVHDIVHEIKNGINIVPDKGTEIRATVASIRLDAVIAAAWNLSRSAAFDLVGAGRVQVDHLEELRPDRFLKEGAILSVRGFGRVKLQQIMGRTRKNRLSVMLTRF